MAPGENLFFLLAWVSTLVAFVTYWVDLFLSKPGAGARWGLRAMKGALFFGIVALVLRCSATGYAPMSNLYESLSFFSVVSIVAFLLAWRWMRLPILGAFVSPICLGLLSMASRFRPESLRPLMPALRHSWLLPLHVAIAFLGEACFAVGFAAALIYLLKSWVQREEVEERSPWPARGYTAFLATGGFCLAALLGYLLFRFGLRVEPRLASGLSVVARRGILFVFACLGALWTSGPGSRHVDAVVGRVAKAAPSLEVLDRLSYAFIAIGYPLFALGAIVLGMAWAHRAWGRYWGWDPKETWSLITFFVYSIYVHSRYLRGWKGAWAATFAVLGFLATLFTFLGVNLLLSGLHSYASS